MLGHATMEEHMLVAPSLRHMLQTVIRDFKAVILRDASTDLRLCGVRMAGLISHFEFRLIV